MNQPQPHKPDDAEDAKPAVDASDPRQVGERQKSAKLRELRRVNGLKKVLEQPDSRLWLWDLLTFCGISRTSFTGNSTTFFNEGQRNVGLKVQADMVKNFPEQYINLLKEGEQNA